MKANWFLTLKIVVGKMSRLWLVVVTSAVIVCFVTAAGGRNPSPQNSSRRLLPPGRRRLPQYPRYQPHPPRRRGQRRQSTWRGPEARSLSRPQQPAFQRRRLQHDDPVVTFTNESTTYYGYYPDRQQPEDFLEERSNYSYKTKSSYSKFNQRPSVKRRDPCECVYNTCNSPLGDRSRFIFGISATA